MTLQDQPSPVFPTDGATQTADSHQVAVSEILSALSRALDLTEGQPLGHSVRACVVGMRLGEASGLSQGELAELYYALLLKDSGCSSNAAHIAALFGSHDHDVKPRMKAVDWDDRTQFALETWRNSGMQQSLWSRMRYFMGMARTENMTRDIIEARCERGADIAHRLGFPSGTVEAIRSLDEHWNGKGYPHGKQGDEIPLMSRILNISQTVEVFLSRDGVDGVEAVLRERRGRWFDPELTDFLLDWRGDEDFWASVQSREVEAEVLSLEPAAHVRSVDEQGIDDIAQAFADIIDAKSPFTYRHSSQVAAFACAIGVELGFDDATLTRTRRAGLLHDIGKVGVSNRILDKNGPLDSTERAAIEQHPLHTWEILRRVSAFSGFARQASTHHEKLDGTGYPWRLEGDDLDAPSRALVVADIYEALTASRPYRGSMSVEEALSILDILKGTKIDILAVDALASIVTRPGHRPEDEAL